MLRGSVDYESISTDEDLRNFCDSVAEGSTLAFDTEFVSEDSYQPDLCLIQVAVAGRLVIIDPKPIEDVIPFWELLASPHHKTIAHAGREEFRFALAATGQRPHELFDVQLAAAFVGLEYPAAYGTLVQKLLGRTLGKGETRTDWRRRPLSRRQLEYALQDVLHLEPLYDVLIEKLDRLERRSWMQEEMLAWQDKVEAADNEERWRKVSGISKLSSRGLAIVRELWRWREEEARERNRPARRVLRDDLIVELAKRQSSDIARIRAVRGIERRELEKHHATLAARIDRALSLTDDECPKFPRKQSLPQFNVLGQFLSTALNSVCRRAQVAPSLVGTAQDVRELIAYDLNLAGSSKDHPPALTLGWRAEVVGKSIEKVMHGKMSIRVEDPMDENPLIFEKPAGE